MTYSVNFANYTIGEDAYQNVREVCRHYGKKALLIGGELALKAGKEKLIQALASEIQIVDTVLFAQTARTQEWKSWQSTQKNVVQT